MGMLKPLRRGALHRLAATCLVLVVLFGLSPMAVRSAWADQPYQSSNAGDQDYSRWASPVSSHLVETSAGDLMRVEYDEGADVLRIEEYADDGTLPSARTMGALELAPEGVTAAQDVLWGGFFAGSQNYFVVTGQANPAESDDVHVMRVSKFDHAWNYISAVDLSGINTRVPFDAGSLRMLETDGELYIRTAHTMYTSDDGLNHQSNMTFIIDEATMQPVDGFWDVMNIGNAFGYVSHSFNQFVTELNGTVYALDHGDAYPRAVVIKRLGATGSNSYTEVLDIYGEIGDNSTGAAVGGFAASETKGTLLAVGTSAPQDGSVRPGAGSRNVWLSVTPSDLGTTSFTWLTSFATDSAEEALNPVLAKVNDDLFMVAWNTSAGQLNYLFVDGTGARLGDIATAEGSVSDCQPIVHDGALVWYATGSGYSSTEPVFYRIDTTTRELTTVDTAPGLSVGGIEPSYTYTGSAIEPKPVVTRGNATLAEGADYTLSYEDNVHVGRATLTVTPSDGSEAAVVHFTVVPASLEDAQISVPEVYYTGRPLEPAPSVSFNGMALVEDRDYVIVSYDDNVEIGEGSVRLRGTGDFTDTVDVAFTIAEEPSDYGFPDVTPGDWYATRDVLGYALSHRLMNGYDNGLFGPYDFITRGQVACILYNMAGQPAATSPDFADVDYGEYYGGAIRWARAHGVVNGYGDNTFAPERIVSRQELCAMLANYAEKIGGMTIESDCTVLDAISGADQVAGWARTVVGWAVDHAIISGEVVDGVAQVNPEGGAWRASAAKMVGVLHRDVL